MPFTYRPAKPGVPKISLEFHFREQNTTSAGVFNYLAHLNWGGHFRISVLYINNEIIHYACYLAISTDPFFG